MHTPVRRWLGWVPVFLVVFGFLGFLGWAMLRPQTGGSGVSTNNGPATVAVLSRPAADFTLPLYDPFNGQPEFRLSDYRGQVVVVNYWASWCPPCREEAPVLEQMWRQYQGQGVVFLGVNVWDTESNARGFLQEFGPTFPNGIDERGRTAVEYGVTGLPETFFITPDGLISRKVIGAVTAAMIEKNIAEARDAASVDPQ